jgi:hypothetical protein
MKNQFVLRSVFMDRAAGDSLFEDLDGTGFLQIGNLGQGTRFLRFYADIPASVRSCFGAPFTSTLRRSS